MMRRGREGKDEDDEPSGHANRHREKQLRLSNNSRCRITRATKRKTLRQEVPSYTAWETHVLDYQNLDHALDGNTPTWPVPAYLSKLNLRCGKV